MRAPFLVVLLALAGCARHDNTLITSAGKYAARGGKISVELATYDAAHVAYRVEWTTTKPNGVQSLFALGSTKTPQPVAADRWAATIVGEDEFWFFDGQIYSCYKGVGDELSLSQSCTDAKIEERAPEVLRKWVASKRPSQPPETTSAKTPL